MLQQPNQGAYKFGKMKFP